MTRGGRNRSMRVACNAVYTRLLTSDRLNPGLSSRMI